MSTTIALISFVVVAVGYLATLYCLLATASCPDDDIIPKDNSHED